MDFDKIFMRYKQLSEPEVILEGHFNNKCDVWALGCIIYELFSSNKAFIEDWSVVDYSRNGILPAKMEAQITNLQRDIVGPIRNMLAIDPPSRPSAKSLVRLWEGV